MTNNKIKTNLRIKCEKIKPFRCKNLIAVLENPKTIENIGSTIRNVNAFGVEKLYVIDGYNLLPDKWDEMRERNSLNKISVGSIKYTFIKKFKNTKECINHLNNKKFISYVTSPHIKGKVNINLNKTKFTTPRLAIWFGNESHGISEEAIKYSNQCINIDMFGLVESLNLGTCSGIVLYEAAKQRRNYKK